MGTPLGICPRHRVCRLCELEPHILFVRNHGGTSLIPESAYASHNASPTHLPLRTNQIPTLVLAIATISPNLRSDVLFATTFFLTSIVLPVRLGLSFFLQRARVTGGSMGPGILMARIFPLYAFWFSGCVKSFVKQSQQGKKKKRVADGNGPVVARREHPSMPNGNPTASPHTSSFTSPSPRPSTFSCRRVALRLAMRQRWDQFRLSRAGRHFGEMQRRLRDVLPMRELVYDYVGIERGDIHGEIVRRVGVSMNKGITDRFNIFGCSSGHFDLNVRMLVITSIIFMNSPDAQRTISR
ncbi:hypothetical protein EDD16DRAFT_1646631 [Pisolithus croceorrhizus]|nr:hypothetical protein EDD16DRAFT_1646631 [Pisolithus croceorrhizus]